MMDRKRTWKRASLRHWIKRYSRDEKGSITIELMIFLPFLLWTFLTLAAIFFTMRAHGLNQKAAFTIGDLISRETEYIDADYTSGARDLLAYLTNSELGETSLRVTTIKYDADNETYLVGWSKNEGSQPENLPEVSENETLPVWTLSSDAIVEWNDKLPIIPDGEAIVVVETFVDYHPPFNTGLPDKEIYNFVFTRQRYADQLKWQD